MKQYIVVAVLAAVAAGCGTLSDVFTRVDDLTPEDIQRIADSTGEATKGILNGATRAAELIAMIGALFYARKAKIRTGILESSGIKKLANGG